MSKPSKEVQLKRNLDKGLEWCAKKLVASDRMIDRLKEQMLNMRYHWDITAENNALRNANENMARVLTDNGIRPVHLTIEYAYNDCKNCPDRPPEGEEYSDELAGYCWERENYGECPVKTGVRSCGFYDWRVEDAEFSGTTSDFKALDLVVLKITDDRTGKVVWEQEEEGEDE